MINDKLYNCAGKVCKDTREIKKGQVYIAIRGDNYDGHEFVKEAIEKGAIAAIVDYEIPDVDLDKLIIVDDTLKAINDIARYVRNASSAKIIGVTGSSGKTSTKEMLKVAFESQGKVYATAGNLNSTLGMPLVLANMPIDTEIAIIEMGMNHIGEVAQMTEIAKPDAVVITNIGHAHHEFFPTPLDIARAKSEIFQGMNQNGIAIIHNGEYFDFLADEANKYTHNIFSFGDCGDVKLLEYENGNCEISLFGEVLKYTLQFKGKHQATNSLSVLGVVKKLGKNVNTAIENLVKMSPIKGRGEVSKINFASGKIILIDEAYNANPDSMAAAIKSIVEYDGVRKIAVLGEMRELGEKSIEFHKKLLPAVLQAGIDKVYCCCDDMIALYEALPAEKKGGWAKNSQELWVLFKSEIKNDDIILVKGSLGSNMLYIVDCIKSIK